MKVLWFHRIFFEYGVIMAGKNILVPLLLCLLAAACDNNPTAVDSCGDGIVDPGEQCDSGPGGQSCVSLGYYNEAGVLSCTADCRFDVSDCGGWCGDGVVDAAKGEQCDQSNLNGQTCESRGFSGGPLGCDSTCLFNVSQCVSTCGNSIRETGETCDDGDTDAGDGCSAVCQTESGWTCDLSSPNLCTTTCGDHLVAGAEECDLDDLGGQTCLTLNYYGGDLGCSDACLLDRSSCEEAGSCGDGVVQEGFGEICDGDNLGGGTCATNHFWTGTLACDHCLNADTSGCSALTVLAAGLEYTCAIDSTGQAWCWGRNNTGQLGVGTTVDSLVPVPVVQPLGTTFTKIVTGWNHVCALDSSGNAWCWGDGESGKLGNGQVTDQTTPVAVTMPAGKTFTTLSAGNNHTCALDQLGAGWCWGEGGNLALGNGSSNNQITPRAVIMTGHTYISISAGGNFSCAVDSNGEAWCWGANLYGQLGDGTTNDSASPVSVSGLNPGYIQVACGALHACAVVDSPRRLHCWGNNFFGQLGDGTTTQSNVPKSISFTAVTSTALVTAGSRHTCTATTAGEAWCWGDGVQGQLGDGANSLQNLARAVVMPAGVQFQTLSPSYIHSCALDTAGLAWCWGAGGNGRTGLGSTSDTNIPTAVLPPPQ